MLGVTLFQLRLYSSLSELGSSFPSPLFFLWILIFCLFTGKDDLKKGLHQSVLTHPHHCGGVASQIPHWHFQFLYFLLLLVYAP